MNAGAYREQGGGCSGPIRRSAWVLVGRACRLALVSTAVGCALVGALTAPPYLVLLIAPACAFCLGNAVAILLEGAPGLASVRRAAVLSGAWTGLLVLALPGADALGVDGATYVLALVVLSVVALAAWVAENRGRSHRQDDTEMDEEEMRGFIRSLPTSVLLREWRDTGRHLQPGADLDRRAEAILVRTLLLEEFSFRDPVGVGRWLTEGDEDVPERYLRDDRRASS
jgi:hypothetical protein